MNNKTTDKTRTILMIEDNPDDIVLAREAVDLSGYSGSFVIVEDGEEALEYLFKKEKYCHALRPDLIFMDWNLPCFSGKEVLGRIKEDASLRSIPVIILSTSKDSRDIMDMYKGLANCYITKPLDINHFIKVIDATLEFWFRRASLPK